MSIRGRDWRDSPGAIFAGLAALIVATFAARDAAVQVMAFQYPAVAARLAPANATAITRVFDRTLLDANGLEQNHQQWIRAAKQALRADPLNASGIRLVAYLTELTPGGAEHARELMLLSERASRRDLLAQIWLIEDSVRRSDVAGALKHYDRALSVRPAAAGQLFPVLVPAASEPPIQVALAPYLRANRPWVPSFLSVVVAKSSDLTGAANLFRRYGGSKIVPSHAIFESTLLRRLVLAGDMQEALVFASQTGAAASLKAFGYTAATIQQRFRPLTWTLYDGTDGEVTVGPAESLKVTVRPDTKIIAASRIIAPLAAGAVLRLRVTYPNPATAPLITWRAYCRRKAGSPEQFWVRDLPADTAVALVAARIDPPAGCTGVQVDVEAAGADGAADFTATIDRVDLAAR